MSRPIFAAALLAMTVTSAVAWAESFENELTALLEEGWGDSFRSVSLAQKHYDAAAPQAGGDLRLHLAMALVNARHRRYSTADGLLKEVLEIDPQHRAAREMQIWILMLSRKYTEGLTAINSQVGKLPPGEAGNESLGLFGSLYGYLDGPGSSAVAPNVLADHEKRLLAQLSPTQQKIFQAARGAIRRQYQEMALDHEQAKEEAKQQQESEKAELKEQLSKQGDKVAEQKESVDSQASEVEQDATQKLAELEKQMTPLNAEVARLNVVGARLNAEIAALTAQINTLLGQAATTDDPAQQAILQAQANRLIGIRGRYQADYAAADAEARRINAARLQLEGERRQAIAAYQAKMQALGKAAKQLERTEKRIAQDTKRAARPATGASSRVRSLSAKVTALSTYVEFPLDRERQRILDSLK